MYSVTPKYFVSITSLKGALYNEMVVISGADSECHFIFLVKVNKMYSDMQSLYLLQISLPFHHVFFTVKTFNIAIY